MIAARYYELTGDRPYLNWVSKRIDWFMTVIGRQMRNDRTACCGRSGSPRTSPNASTVCTPQTTVWEGLNAIGAVWAATGHPAHAARAHRLAAGCGPGSSARSRRPRIG